MTASVGCCGTFDGFDLGSIMKTICTRESGCNYTAQNPSTSASGAYQFVDGTWGGYGGYLHAKDAPPDVQDAKAIINIKAYLTTGAANPSHPQLEWVPACWYAGVGGATSHDWSTYAPNPGRTIQGYVDDWIAAYNSIASAPYNVGGGSGTPKPCDGLTQQQVQALLSAILANEFSIQPAIDACVKAGGDVTKCTNCANANMGLSQKAASTVGSVTSFLSNLPAYLKIAAGAVVLIGAGAILVYGATGSKAPRVVQVIAGKIPGVS